MKRATIISFNGNEILFPLIEEKINNVEIFYNEPIKEEEKTIFDSDERFDQFVTINDGKVEKFLIPKEKTVIKDWIYWLENRRKIHLSIFHHYTIYWNQLLEYENKIVDNILEYFKQVDVRECSKISKYEFISKGIK